MDTMNPLDKTDVGRKQLKAQLLNVQLESIRVKLDTAMSVVETMTREYATTMLKIQELNVENADCKQNTQHTELLSRMIGESNETPINYNKCRTSEEMLHLMVGEIEQVKKMEGDALNENTLPDVGDNSEIWERIAQAQQALSIYKPDTSTSPVSPITEEVEEVEEVEDDPSYKHEVYSDSSLSDNSDASVEKNNMFMSYVY